jgi:hypothetical protein
MAKTVPMKQGIAKAAAWNEMGVIQVQRQVEVQVVQVQVVQVQMHVGARRADVECPECASIPAALKNSVS